MGLDCSNADRRCEESQVSVSCGRNQISIWVCELALSLTIAGVTRKLDCGGNPEAAVIIFLSSGRLLGVSA